MTKEVELKLSILAEDIDHLKHHSAIKKALIGKSKTRTLLSTYFDTPQLTLFDCNITLRIRRVSGLWTLDSGSRPSNLLKEVRVDYINVSNAKILQ